MMHHDYRNSRTAGDGTVSIYRSGAKGCNSIIKSDKTFLCYYYFYTTPTWSHAFTTLLNATAWDHCDAPTLGIYSVCAYMSYIYMHIYRYKHRYKAGLLYNRYAYVYNMAYIGAMRL